MRSPISTYARDAATDLIAGELSDILEKMAGWRPHVIQCHLHRSKVECNRDLSEVAVAQVGEEAEYVHSTYHQWTEQALQSAQELSGSALLLDLHGHGHSHDMVEL